MLCSVDRNLRTFPYAGAPQHDIIGRCSSWCYYFYVLSSYNLLAPSHQPPSLASGGHRSIIADGHPMFEAEGEFVHSSSVSCGLCVYTFLYWSSCFSRVVHDRAILFTTVSCTSMKCLFCFFARILCVLPSKTHCACSSRAFMSL